MRDEKRKHKAEGQQEEDGRNRLIKRGSECRKSERREQKGRVLKYSRNVK